MNRTILQVVQARAVRVGTRELLETRKKWLESMAKKAMVEVEAEVVADDLCDRCLYIYIQTAQYTLDYRPSNHAILQA